MKGARTVILIETILLITIVVSAGSIYSRFKVDADAKDRTIAELQQQHRDLVLRYDDLNWQFNQLQEQVTTASSDEPTTVLPDNDLGRQLDYERRRYKELEDAFDGLATRFDQYVQQSESRETDAVDPESDRRPERGGRRGGRRSDTRGMDNEFIDGRLEELQQQMDATDDPAEQERLTKVSTAIQDMRDLRDRMRDAGSDAERQQISTELSDLRQEFRGLMSRGSELGGDRPAGRMGGRRGGALTDRTQPQNP